MNHKKVLSLISNILFYLGAGLSALAIVLTITIRASLPPGVCPIDNNRPLYFTAVAVLISSFVLSVLAGRLKKRTNKEQ